MAFYGVEGFLVTGWHFLLGLCPLVRDFCISIISLLNVLWLTHFWLRNIRNTPIDQSTRMKSSVLSLTVTMAGASSGKQCHFLWSISLVTLTPLNPESSCRMLEKKIHPCLVFVVLMDLVARHLLNPVCEVQDVCAWEWFQKHNQLGLIAGRFSCSLNLSELSQCSNTHFSLHNL